MPDTGLFTKTMLFSVRGLTFRVMETEPGKLYIEIATMGKGSIEVVSAEKRRVVLRSPERKPIDKKSLNKLLDQPIDTLALRESLLNLLKGAGISSIRELVNTRQSGLLKIKNFGYKKLRDVRQSLHQHGLSLWTER